MLIPMPEQNAEMHREFHEHFGTRYNRFCRQVRPAFQHPPPISGCSLPSPKIACLSPHRSRRKRVSVHRRRAPICRKHVPRTVVVPKENDGQTSVDPCLADASWGLALHEPFARDVVVEAQKQFTRLFARIVGEINPELSMEERELRGALIVSSCQGLVIFLRWSEDDASRMHAFRRAVKVVWSGLGKADE